MKKLLLIILLLLFLSARASAYADILVIQSLAIKSL